MHSRVSAWNTSYVKSKSLAIRRAALPTGKALCKAGAVKGRPTRELHQGCNSISPGRQVLSKKGFSGP